MKVRLQLHEALDGWRWRLTASNSRIIAESGEGYKRRRDCLRMADRLFLKQGRLVRPLDDTGNLFVLWL